MAYRFPLATVLRVKQSMEKLEELALQKIFVEMSQVRQQIELLTADIVRARQSLDEAMQQVLPAVEIESRTNGINLAAHRKQELLNALADLNQKREMQSRKYHAAHRSRTVLSDLQARQKDAYEQERARNEQKFIDEIFASRSQRSALRDPS